MNKHSYTYKKYDSLKHTKLLMFTIFCQIGINLFLVLNQNERTLTALIMGNMFFCSLTVPHLILYFNYLKYAKGTSFNITTDYLELTRKDSTQKINKSDINSIESYSTTQPSRIPWLNYSWFKINSRNGQSIIVNHFILNISDFWLDSLIKGISKSKLKSNQSMWPKINDATQHGI